ncbi:MAG: hypothetical protein KBC18_04485 [Candidatus Saccharicenans sp.]|nr:hypothetical protein [Candidatus Saccharicenans sp.]
MALIQVGRHYPARMEKTCSVVYLQEFYHNFIMNVVDKYLGDARSQL